MKIPFMSFVPMHDEIKRRKFKNHSILLVKDRMEVIQLMISLKIETLLEGKAVERN